jgi:aspartyl-tRNA(Asn)/glutamyl-tRNA(Gln) amidotransferase subunit A
MALSWTLDKIGPMARTAEDAGSVLAVIAGKDRSDATASGRHHRPLDADQARAAVAKVRVAFAEEDVIDHASPAAKAALENGVEELRRVARNFVRATLPSDMPFGPMVGTVYGAEGATIFAELIEGEHFDELVDARQKAGLKAALEIRARDYLQAMRLRQKLTSAFNDIFKEADVILSVGRAITATPITQPLDMPPTTASNPQPSRRPGNLGLIPAGNLAGVPAIFFPCGLGTDGLPVGLQLVGPPFSEPLLVALAAAYQRETDHHTRTPRPA